MAKWQLILLVTKDEVETTPTGLAGRGNPEHIESAARGNSPAQGEAMPSDGRLTDTYTAYEEFGYR